jgi:hypothetical protein
MAAGDVTLKDLIKSIDPEIQKILSEKTRDLVLNKRPHVLDISYQSLLVNNRGDRMPGFEKLYKTFISVVKEKAVRKYSSIEEIPRTHFTGSTPYLVYVDGGEKVQLLLAMSYDSIQSFISDVVRNPKLIDTAFGIERTEKAILNKKGQPSGDVKISEVSRLDIGHIPTAGSEFFVSPLEYKIAGILDHFEVNGVNPDSPAYQLAQSTLDKISSIQSQITYSFRNSTPEVFEKIENVFGKVFVGVTIQTSDINQKDFGAKELQAFREFEEKLAIFLADKKLVSKFLGVHGSNTILQDIEQALISIVKTGKAKLNKHSNQKITSTKKTIGNNVQLPNSSTIVSKIPHPSVESAQENRVDLVSLQSLINMHLQDVISANMGNGARKDILNYRTGRFASSVQVERLTMSKEGMITAFYNYMKNPYATFSEGGKQGLPTSRDPKLLIAKSIREIASERVANRLRAVVI